MNHIARFPGFGLPSLVWLVFAAGAVAADDERDKWNARFDADIAGLTAQIEKSPKSVELYSRRGDAFFFRGKFAEAVADYEKMVELRPELDAAHWRKGLAYFYAERYEDAAQQFDLYRSVDSVDRETGIWRYFAQVETLGREKAREGLLKYDQDDREPLPDVYRLFAGELTADELLARIERSKVTPAEKQKRMFYAELYVGLNEFVEGRPESAEKHLAEAVKNEWGAKAGGGPGWMWHVGRVHRDLLVDKRTKSDKAP
jgi:lipoprotein NlpI